jgi:tetratricopeptide (TPR) repeat protein
MIPTSPTVSSRRPESMSDANPPQEVDILDPAFLGSRNLTQEQQTRIAELQAEIEAIWSKPGNYKIDDEAWKKMPLFMENVTEDDIEAIPDLAALQNVKYEDVNPLEKAETCKAQGNKMLLMSLNPDQVNFKNVARAAVHSYNEAIACNCGDRKLTSQVYANRSMANFVLENYGHGLEDAQKAIVLDKNYTKAYYRGAKCAERIRKFDTARQLVEYGLKTNPPPGETAVQEFQAVLAAVKEGEELAAGREKKNKIQARSAAADSNFIVRKLTSAGINVGNRSEVSSDQWAQQRAHKPYFDETGVLHVPILILYDEYQQSDFAQDVACDTPLGDLIESMLPCPWDDKGRYQMIEGLTVFYKIDDGVAMPKYYRVDPDWQIFEILRTKTYLMPSLVPTFHVVPEGSEFLADIAFEETR